MNRPGELGFMHTFLPGCSTRTLLFLHGPGGNENDLVLLGRQLDPDANLLVLRGKAVENGMPRSFQRLAEGIFDEQSLIRRTHELADFIEQASAKYRLNRQNLFAVGDSNGANIVGSLLLLRPQTLAGAKFQTIVSECSKKFRKVIAGQRRSHVGSPFRGDMEFALLS